MSTLTGTEKLIERMGIGSWVLTYDGEESEWMRVRAVLHGHDTRDGRKVTELRGISVSGEYVAVRNYDNTPVTAMTAVQARKAGMIVSEGAV